MDVTRKKPTVQKRKTYKKVLKRNNLTKVNRIIDYLKASFPLPNETGYKGDTEMKRMDLHGVDFDGWESPVFVSVPRGEVAPESVLEPNTLTYVASGSFNNAYKHEDKLYRITKSNDIVLTGAENEGFNGNGNDDARKELMDLYDESLLTIRLSGLGIATRLYECYFTQSSDKPPSKKNPVHYRLIHVSEFSKNGSLSQFMTTRKFVKDGKLRKKIAFETVQLYKRMCENYIFCTDVKSENMVVTNDLNVRLIDFDTKFCAAKESKNDRTLDTIYSELKPKYNDVTRHDIIKGFFVGNIIQVAALCIMHKYIKEDTSNHDFAQRLIDHVEPHDVEYAIQVADVNVGDATLFNQIKYYLTEEIPHLTDARLNAYYHRRLVILGGSYTKNSARTLLGLIYVALRYGIWKMNSIFFEYLRRAVETYNNTHKIQVKHFISKNDPMNPIFYVQNGVESLFPPKDLDVSFDLKDAIQMGLLNATKVVVSDLKERVWPTRRKSFRRANISTMSL